MTETQTSEKTVFQGVAVSSGRVTGPVLKMALPAPEPTPGLPLASTVTVEGAHAAIDAASTAVVADLNAVAAKAHGGAKMVLEATAMMASDPSLIMDAKGRVTSQNIAPERAIWESAKFISDQLAALGGYMAERVRDVEDVRDRLIAAVTGKPAPGVPTSEDPFILVAHDLAPADTATLDPAVVIGLVTEGGGPTSHTAILARELGLPAVVAAEGVLSIEAGTVAIVDGAAGTLQVNPSNEEIAAVLALSSVKREFNGDGRTSDDHKVQLLANVGDPAGAKGAAAAGAQGVGLFRTEFCFLDRQDAPSKAEQVEQYRMVLSAFPGKKVVIRTLDAGADKPLPFLTDTTEENPALGVRGLRTSWRSPEILETQLEAIAEAAAAETAEPWVMAPMIATVAESRNFVELCQKYGLNRPGVMVEVPSAALTSDRILDPAKGRATFASIGTNDLTQYAMAADRLLADLSHLSTAWQPGVLHLIAATTKGGGQHDAPVGVCGEAAADPALAIVLVGLGVTSLSMTPRALPDVAFALNCVTLAEAQRLADLALNSFSAEEARATVREACPFLAENGL
ncbi:phosphoenolpyruvate--protein phosphotransferase [Micrococcales bacterium 31B]|nr:phosphoenolpyruvate--protein phosphotransferase [Micrococcales bacterium 31B]